MRDAPQIDRERVSAGCPAENFRVVRQPILDEFGSLHGYELLFGCGSASLPQNTGETGTGARIEDIALFGLERLTKDVPVFLSCSAEDFTADLASILPANRTVLEIPAAEDAFYELSGLCRRWKAEGFRFALVDDANAREPHPLRGLLDYVKVNSSVLDENGKARLRDLTKGTWASTIATGVDSHAVARKAQSEGFKYFQGFYFCQAQPVQKKSIPACYHVHIAVLQELLKDPLNLRTLVPLVERDVSLVYHVLRLVNSPVYAIRGSISSVQSAICIIGDVAFRRLATLAIHNTLSTGRPKEILNTALVRARFCAQSALACNLDSNEQHLLGMLSLLPAMVNVPMEVIASELPLRSEVRSALLGEPVAERSLLHWIECHERNDVAGCKAIEELNNLDEWKLMQSYLDALAWGSSEPDPGGGSSRP